MARTATATRAPEQEIAGEAPNDNLPATTQGKAAHPLVAFKSYMDERMGEIALALPPYMTPERFGRVVLTALQRKPDLLKCTRQSLFNACMLAAQDGLLPDGREGAIAPYGESTDGKRAAEIATWMPMVEGLRKKARNSGEISNWEVHVVRARDQFEVVLGDQPRIDHKPYFGSDDPGEIIGAYSIAWLKDGTISRDVMTIRDIKKIEAKSKASKGPWKDMTFFPEMCKKTVARRHYKQLPHAAEMDEFIKRLDDREGFDENAIEHRTQQRIGSTSAAFDAFAGAGKAPEPATIEHDPQTGEIAVTAETASEQAPAEATTAPKEAEAPKEADPPKEAAQGQSDISKGDEVHRGGELDDELDLGGNEQTSAAWPLDKQPTNSAEYAEFVKSYIVAPANADPAALKGWFTGKEQRDLRLALKVAEADFMVAKEATTVRIRELSKKPAG